MKVGGLRDTSYILYHNYWGLLFLLTYTAYTPPSFILPFEPFDSWARFAQTKGRDMLTLLFQIRRQVLPNGPKARAQTLRCRLCPRCHADVLGDAVGIELVEDACNAFLHDLDYELLTLVLQLSPAPIPRKESGTAMKAQICIHQSI